MSTEIKSDAQENNVDIDKPAAQSGITPQVNMNYCEVCKIKAGNVYRLYYGHESEVVSETSYSKQTETTRTTRGEYETVVLCDKCLRRGIVKNTYVIPLTLLLSYTIPSFIIGAMVITRDKSGSLMWLSLLLIIPPVFTTLRSIYLALDALKYFLSEKYRDQKYEEDVRSAWSAKQLRKKQRLSMWKKGGYNAWFTEAEYNEILNIDFMDLDGTNNSTVHKRL